MNEKEEVDFIENSQAINNRENFYVWSHYQRHAGLPFDDQSWQMARERALDGYRVRGKKARAATATLLYQ